jgi:eukaryotic-like serine/threonine-protein kinase
MRRNASHFCPGENVTIAYKNSAARRGIGAFGDRAMGEAFSCVQCGKPVPADAPQGLCSACAKHAERDYMLPPASSVQEAATMPPEVRTGEDTVALPEAGATAEPTAPDAGATFVDIPGYEILGELGRGGMGIVYKARQIKLNRIVALKMILAGGHAGEADLARFRTEAEAIARVKHGNIIQIYEISEHEGKPYFALEYCGGGSLARQTKGTPMPSKEAARIVETLARGIEAAHQQEIIHRDLKPANVLLLMDGTPKITDFGLAKKLDDAGQTQSGAIMGTPSYMAPEQAGGKTKEIGPAVDIYALGAVLYELLTGRPPFKAATPLDTLLQVVDRDPAPPRLLNPNVDGDVETVCLKCLEKDPTRRYDSAQTLADDLERYRVGESIKARSLNLVSKIAFALERSYYDVQFQAYSRIFFGYALIMPACETARFVVYQTRQSVWALLAIEAVRLAALLGLFFWLRPTGLRATGPAGRLMWTVWVGYFFTLTVVGAAHSLVRGVTLDEDPTLYPVIAAVTGMAFYVLGSSYWGWCYAIGLAFHLLALLMPLDLQFAPLAHGALWAIALGAIAFRLRRLSVTEQPSAIASNV